MVKDTRSSRKAKDDEASPLKKNLSNGLRRSTREASLKKRTSSSPSNTRRSERLERQTPTKSPPKKQPEKVENANSSSLRRSERGNKFQPSSSSSSKKSGKGSITTKGGKIKNSVKDLTVEAREVNGAGKQHSNTGSKRKKRLDARSYRSMFKTNKKQLKESDATKQRSSIKHSPDNSGTGGNIPEKVQEGEAEGSGCTGEKGSKYSSGRVGDVDGELSNFNPKKLSSGTLKDEVHMEPSDSADNNAHTEDTCESVGGFTVRVSGNENIPLPCSDGGDTERNLDSSERAQVDSSETEKLQEKELHLASDWKSNDAHLESVYKRLVSKRKRDNVEVVSVESTVVADKDTCSSTADVIPSPSLRCKMNCSSELSPTCSKRQRHLLHTSQVGVYMSSVSGSKSDSSRFVEFWVPVRMSNVQLEQYCSTLLSNRTVLRSCSRNDRVGALREILLSNRKCCNHPYVVNPSLQLSLTKDHQVGDILDIGIKASGKLQLLDSILSESRNQGLRLLILFQSIGGSGRDPIGDILDDYLLQRFGPDSYERIDGGGYLPSRKQAALNNFNKEKGRFVFLLETRACLPSIKLSSVDAVIIFYSDWNPLNDLRALQRITIDSKFEHINIFRLYSFCTIEENILILAKKEMAVDIQSISPGTSHMLLMWGASYLFSKLDEFHCDNALDSSANLVPQDSLLRDVVQEFLSVVAKHENVSCKFISRAQQNGGSYANTPLLGEQKVQLTVEELPHMFWGKLLDKGFQKWKFLSLSSQRNRKRVRYFDDSPSQLDAHGDENQNRRKKLGGNNIDSSTVTDVAVVGRGVGSKKEIKGNSGTKTNNNLESTLKSVASTSQPLYKNSASSLPGVVDGLSAVPKVQMVDSEEKRKLCDEQRRLHHLLKPEISQLCDILQFPEDVKNLTEQFLDYVINNHRVSREPMTVLQAFQISVCWTAASFLDHKIDHRESLVLARENLKFNCKDDEADLIFSKMQFMKKAFLFWYLKDSSPLTNDLARESVDGNCIVTALPSLQNIKVKVEEGSAGPECSDTQAYPSMLTVEMTKRGILRRVKKVHKRMEKLKQKHIKEVEEFHKLWEEKKARLEKEHRLESAVIRSIHGNLPAGMDKLKILDSDYAKKYQEFDCEMTVGQTEIESRQLAEKNQEEQRIARLVEGVKSWAQAELLDKLPLPESQDGVEQLYAFGQTRIPEVLKDTSLVSGDLLDQQRCGRVASGIPGSQVEQSKTSEVANGDLNILVSKMAAFKGDKQDVSSHNRCIDFSLVTNIAGDATLDNPFGTEPPDDQLTEDAAAQISPAVPAQMATLGRPVDAVPMEWPETAHEEVMGGDPNEMLNANLERERDANHIDFVASSRSISLETNQQDGAGTSISPVVPPEMATLGRPADMVPMERPEMPHEGVIGGDPNAMLNANLERERDANHIDFVSRSISLAANQQDGALTSNSKEPADSQQSLANSPLVQPIANPTEGGSLPGIQVLGDDPSQSLNQMHDWNEPVTEMQNTVLEAGPLASHHTEISCDDEVASSLLTTVSEPTFMTLGHIQQSFTSSSTAEDQPSGDCRQQRDLVPMQQEQNPAGFPNIASSQSLLDPLVHPTANANSTQCVTLPSARASPALMDSNNHSMQASAPVVTRLHSPSSSDPLQVELERLRREMDQTIKTHEDLMLCIESDCEKEIEETVTQIRGKYQAKRQEAEASFLMKKRELDTNQNKALLNKLLAEAFRSKCVDYRAASAFQQATPSSKLLQSQQSATRPPAAGAFSASPSSIGTQSVAPSSRVAHSSTVLPVMPVRSPARPPLISSITPTAGNQQHVTSEARARPPHLPLFRLPILPSPVSQSPAVPFATTCQQLTSLIPPASSPFTFVSLPLRPLQPPPARPPSVQESSSGTNVWPHQAGSIGRFSPLHHSAVATPVLLRDTGIHGAQAGALPRLLDQLERDLSSFGTSGNIAQPSSSLAGSVADVVCLSDDD